MNTDTTSTFQIPEEYTNKKFKDRFGAEFDLTILLSTAEDIENADWSNVSDIPEISMTKPDRELFEEILKNRRFLVAFAFVVCNEQLKTYYQKQSKLTEIQLRSATLSDDERIDLENQKNIADRAIEDDEFRQRLWLSRFDMESLARLRRAFFAGVGNFFPQMGTVLFGSLMTIEEAEKKVREKVAEAMPNAIQQIRTEVNRMINEFAQDVKKTTEDGTKFTT